MRVTIRAVLFDVGGPLDAEVLSERLIDEHIREALAAAGVTVTHDQYDAANRFAVESFAGNAYKAIIWHLTGNNPETAPRVFQAVVERSAERRVARGGVELRPGVPALIERLAARGLLLGLAANQPVEMIAELDRAGVGRFFAHREVSGTHGYLKPDPRLFLRCCEDLGVAPAECIMVGDRIDNDIAPARLLGMRTVLFRTGRHRAQRSRTWEETPDMTAEDVGEVYNAIVALTDGV